MKYIYMTETELNFANKTEVPENSVILAPYSKKKLIEYILEFPDLEHPLPVYRFQSPSGEIHETLELDKFARLHGLSASGLSKIRLGYANNNHKGWRVALDEGILPPIKHKDNNFSSRNPV